MVLIISPETDTHALCVQKKIRALGGDAEVIDLSLFGQKQLLSNSINKDAVEKILIKGGKTLYLNEVETVWYRRPKEVNIPYQVLDKEDRKFAQAEWHSTLIGAFSGLKARFVSPFYRQLEATKPLQLEKALACGLRIPDTIITNNPRQVEEFVSRHKGKVIHKTLNPYPSQFMDTQRWTSALQNLLDTALPIAPTIFQEEITGTVDFRVTAIGEQLFAAQIESKTSHSAIDSRLDLDVPISPVKLPASLELKLLRLMRELGLLFGTIDLKLSKDNEFIFFEVNPQGQFLYIEILTGLPLTLEMARFLSEVDARQMVAREQPIALDQEQRIAERV